MRSIAEGLRTYLDAHASSGGFPVRLEAAERTDSEGGNPFHVIHRKNGNSYGALDDGDGGSGLRAEIFDIVTYAKSNAQAHSLSDAMASHLVGLSPGTAMGSDRVLTDISDENEQGDFDQSEYGDERGWNIAGAQIWIQHKAA